MKKTLITLLALSMGYTASATQYTTAIEQWDTGYNNYYGWVTGLTGRYYNDTQFDGTGTWHNGTAVVMPEVVTLNSISVIQGTPAQDTTQPTLTGSSKLAVFLRGSSDGQVTTFVGLSDNIVTSTEAGTITYTFSGINLDTTATYQFLFVSAEAQASAFSTAADANNLSAYQNYAGTLYLEHETHSLNAGDGAFLSNTAGPGGWAGQKFVDFTINTSDVAPSVPEPTTATLSLLALAGLAARRRRK